MAELRERLKRVKAQAQAIKQKPLLQRAAAAEQCLESTLYLVEGMIEKIEQLECDEIPFGGGE